MKKRLTGVVAGWTLFYGGLVPSVAQSPETPLKLEIHLYNYSGLTPEALARAEQETARIYRRLGVEMEWRNCPLTPEELAQNTTCDLPAAPTRFTVRLLSNEMAHRFPVGDDIYGFALLPVERGFGVLVNVFADRAQEMAADEGLHRVMLGHVMAHELGHLLLGEAGHPAGTGIMHVPWQTKELERIKQGVMFFLPEQAERIRSQVIARTISSGEPPILSPAALPRGAQAQSDTYQQLLRQGIQLQKEGHYADAGTAFAAALSEVEWLGPDHIAAAQILINIGTVRALQHDDLGARTAFEQALNITEKALGPEHVQVGLTLLTVAMLTHKQGQYAAAEPLYRRAFTILEKNLGLMHERTGFLEASMARLYVVQKRNSEAEALLEKAIPVLENAGEPDEATLVAALADLAEAYRHDGRFAKAGPLYAHILAMVQQKPQALNHDIRTSLRAYVQMLRKMKRKTEAHELEQQLKTMLPR